MEAMDREPQKGKTIFVTVGTTSFDGLIDVIDTAQFHQVARRLGYHHLIIQFGRGKQVQHGLVRYQANKNFPVAGVTHQFNVSSENHLEEDPIHHHHHHHQDSRFINVTAYRYKTSLMDDIKKADLIIGHAGAGTILEALRMHKQIITVVNEALMDNHQIELASHLQSKGYLHATTPSKLTDILQSLNTEQPKPWPKASTLPLYSIIEELTGVNLAMTT